MLELLKKPPPFALINDPEKNQTGALTAVATEIGPLDAGVYTIFSNRNMYLSQHQAAGQPIGDYPVMVPSDMPWAVTVAFGRENYLMVQKYDGADGSWWLNKVSWPY